MPKFRTCCTWDHVTCGQPLTNITVGNLDYRLLFSTIACCSRLSLTVLDYCLSVLDYRMSVLDYRLSVLDSRLLFSTIAYYSRYTFVQFGLPYYEGQSCKLFTLVNNLNSDFFDLNDSTSRSIDLSIDKLLCGLCYKACHFFNVY